MIRPQYFSGSVSLDWASFLTRVSLESLYTVKKILPSILFPGCRFPSLFLWSPYPFDYFLFFSPLGVASSIEVAGVGVMPFTAHIGPWPSRLPWRCHSEVSAHISWSWLLPSQSNEELFTMRTWWCCRVLEFRVLFKHWQPGGFPSPS